MDEVSRIEPMLTENIALEFIDRGSYEGGATVGRALGSRSD